MERCKTCKWWVKATEYRTWRVDDICEPIDPDTGKKMEMPFEVRECTSPNIALFERNPDPCGVSITDGSEYFATIIPGEDFGCINHEPL